METLQSLRSGLASGRLAGCTHLKLSDHLTEFPPEILSLADSLTFLNLSNNQLSDLPAGFSTLKKLKIVFFNNNNFELFPTVLAECPDLSMVSFKANRIKTVPAEALRPTLRWLILTDNAIEQLPESVGRLPRLQKLMLAGNQLRGLPKSLSDCQSLELIRISADQLSALPDGVCQLPKLSWLAYSGNPFCPAEHLAHLGGDLPLTAAEEVEREEVLGEGASGVIYKGQWQDRAIALKLFKGEITSDGLPFDEMNACIAAGSHPNLVNVLACYESDGQKGLVFDYIPTGYQNLGGPPSLESCTRDTYPDDTRFELTVAVKIAKGVASAAAYLHKRGIMHGDLYAHNILVRDDGHCILGDFGAASFYDVDDQAMARSLQQLESRAFGCLLEDLLDRCDDAESEAFKTMRTVQQKCLNSDPKKRPLFDEIVSLLPTG